MTWAELCHDQRFNDLPYRVEMDRYGRIILSPTRARHGRQQSRLVHLLEKHMNGGEVVVELAIETEDATKVADVAWASAEVWRVIQDEYSASRCPEICIEVLSPSNTPQEMADKRQLYFKAGAKEVWTCDEQGVMAFHSPSGQLDCSRLCPAFPPLT